MYKKIYIVVPRINLGTTEDRRNKPMSPSFTTYGNAEVGTERQRVASSTTGFIKV